MDTNELDYAGRLSTRVIMSIINQAGLSITYNLEDGSAMYKKNLGQIVEAIQSTWGLGYKNSEIVHGMVLDAMYAYRSISLLLKTPS